MHLIFDFSYFFRVSFYSKVALANKDSSTGTLYVMFQSFRAIYNRFKPEKITFALDTPPYLRDLAFKEYKANREKSEYDKLHLSDGFAQAAEFLGIIGRRFSVAKKDGFEADDVIAALVKDSDEEILIVSHDSDLYQIMSDKVKMYSPRAKKVLDVDYWKKKFFVEPFELVDLKSIIGDPKDNLEGIPGIGAKRAYNYLRGRASQKIEETIEQHQDLIEFNKKMLKLPFSDEEVEVSQPEKIDPLELEIFFKEKEFKTFLKKFDEWKKMLC